MRAVAAPNAGTAGGKRAAPLAGVRIIELGQVISAPYAGQLLSDLGAEVVKVEPPEGGDSARNPQVTGMGDHSATFITFNHNKKSVVLDLKDPSGYSAFCDLVRQSDVVLTNVLPATARKLRIDDKTLRALNDRVVTCSIQGFRREDPRSDEPTYDLTHQALAGYMLMEGQPADPPLRICIPIADLTAAQLAVNAILAALVSRAATGLGESIEIPMYDSMLSLLTYTATLYLNTGKEPARMGSAHEYTAPWQAVRAGDGDIVIAVRSEKFWQRLCLAVGRPELVDDLRFFDNQHRLANREAMSQVLEEIFQGNSTEFWLARLREIGVPAAPIRTVGQALDEAVAEENDLLRTLEHPELGPIQFVGNPIRFRGSSLPDPLPPPALNEHATELLSRSQEGERLP